LPQSPDTILRKAVERLGRETGADLLALGEVEYFLGKRADESDIYGADDRGYHATSPFVFGERLRREAMRTLGDIGIPVKYGHSEVGYIEADKNDGLIWEQHEIELGLADLPKAAESVLLTHWVLRNMAHANGMQCSFEPIMMRGHAGSGLHFHLSPMRSGIHLGSMREEEPMAEEARWLIGGLVQMGGALMAFGNRRDGSFLRLKQGKEAPNTVTWGEFNRHALIRLPIRARTNDGRAIAPPTIEFRLPDGSAQPFLLLAGIAQAMLYGRDTENLDEVLKLTLALSDRNGADGARPVPRTFGEVADQVEGFREDLERGEVFPSGMISATIDRLRAKTATG
jgi:glutamine synthetase